MGTPAAALPEAEALAGRLTAALRAEGEPDGLVTILAREPNPYAGDARSEVVTCRLAGGVELRLFCKYEARESQCWSDVAYEADVYRQVVHPLQVGALGFFGAHADPGSGEVCLVLEYLDKCMTVAERRDRAALRLAAGWIGRFHAAAEARFGSGPPSCLKDYDAEFYLRHAREALQHLGGREERFPWLRELYAVFRERVGPLLTRRVPVHGDYYPNNILYRGGAVYPIDWELAAVDVGEMDLACLTDGWPEDYEQECEAAYRQARWPAGAPEDFETVLAAARLCLCLQSLNRPDWGSDPHSLWYCSKLRRLAERLGLIPLLDGS